MPDQEHDIDLDLARLPHEIARSAWRDHGIVLGTDPGAMVGLDVHVDNEADVVWFTDPSGQEVARVPRSRLRGEASD